MRNVSGNRKKTRKAAKITKKSGPQKAGLQLG